MTVTVSTLAQRLSTDRQYVQGAQNTVFYNEASLIGPLIPIKGVQGGTGVKLQMVVSGNSSVEVYTEGQSVPARGNQTVITATFAFKHFRVIIGETGHARRAQIAGGLLMMDPDLEVQKALSALRDKITTTFLTDAAAYSLQGIVDATVNFGDQARATYTTLKAYVLDASSAALSTALINKAYSRSQERPYGSRVGVWVASPLQTGKYRELVSGKLALPSISGADVVPREVTAGNAMWITMPDLTTDLLIGLTDVDMAWGCMMNENGNLGGEGGVSGFNVKYLGASDDSDTIQISTALAIYCTEPQRQVKIDSLSTT